MNEQFDSCLEAQDWRYSAAIVGLARFLRTMKLPSNLNEINRDEELDRLKYNKADITEELFLKFAEIFYDDEFQHIRVERLLNKEEFIEEQIKEINALLVGNTVMKKLFAKIKFDGTNKEKILSVINENRLEIVRETFRNKKNMYANYCNTSQLFSESKEVCRIRGYYVDWAKKGKSISYCQDTSLFVGRDISEFDFIPFAFSEHYEALFINYSATLHDLIVVNDNLLRALRKKEEDAKLNNTRFTMNNVLFEEIIETADFLNYDVEMIKKSRDNDFFETVYFRKKSIWILKNLASMKSRTIFNFSLNAGQDYYRNVLDEVMFAVINLNKLDDLIEFILRQQEQRSIYRILITALVRVNEKIYRYVDYTYQIRDGGKGMDRASIERCGEAIAKKLDENKLASYRTKLTSALVFKDYNRVCEIMLQLSNFSGVSLACLMDVFENCEANKNKVYIFIANLRKETSEDNSEGGEQ